MAAAIPPFQSFLESERDTVWRFLVSLVGPAEAEDCFQETFVAALDAYPRLRTGSNPTAWVLAIARNKAIDATRSRARRPVPAEDPAALEPRPGADALGGRGAAAAAANGTSELWRAVRELPERQRSAVALRFIADLPHRDIARAIGCSEDAARRSLHEGLKRLREHVEPEEVAG